MSASLEGSEPGSVLVRVKVRARSCEDRCGVRRVRLDSHAKFQRRGCGLRLSIAPGRAFLLRRKLPARLRGQRQVRCRKRAARREGVVRDLAGIRLRGPARWYSRRRLRRGDRAKSESRNACGIWTWILRAAL